MSEDTDDNGGLGKFEEKTVAKSAPKPAAPAKGPEFYRNPDGGPLTTTKPPEDN